MLAAIPRPRLGYAGAPYGRLNTAVLLESLERHREWSFVSFGRTPAVRLPNAQALPWQTPEGLARCVAAFDVGFMPYDCSDAALYNGMPLKMFDYFALGLPVVATPLLHLREYKDLVYLGETAEELERAVEAALEEPLDSPKRQKRKGVAEAHSMEALGRILAGILG
jgi:Glycosyl transferases group 1